MFVISIPDLGSKIPIYVFPKVGDLQIFKSVSNFTAGLCIWIPFFVFWIWIIISSCPRIAQDRSSGLVGCRKWDPGSGDIKSLLLKVQQILNILEIMDQVNVNYIIDVHFFCNIKLSLLHKEVSYRIIRYQITLLEIATQLDSSHSFSGKLEVQHITKNVQWWALELASASWAES